MRRPIAPGGPHRTRQREEELSPWQSSKGYKNITNQIYNHNNISYNFRLSRKNDKTTVRRIEEHNHHHNQQQIQTRETSLMMPDEEASATTCISNNQQQQQEQQFIHQQQQQQQQGMDDKQRRAERRLTRWLNNALFVRLFSFNFV